MKHDTFFITKKGTRYKIEKRGYRDILVFPVGAAAKINGYAPKEQEILSTNDEEIIEIYKRLDYQNDEYKLRKEMSKTMNR